MNFILHESAKGSIAELPRGEMSIAGVDDAVDLLGNADYQGAYAIIACKEDFSDDFFRLSTGVAGEVLQKFSNYRKRLAIIGDFRNEASKSLRDFISESNRTGHIIFIDNLDAALTELSNN